jgi:hypothetical protein
MARRNEPDLPENDKQRRFPPKREVIWGMSVETLTPSKLAQMLDRTGVRHKVVIISACYSGVFVPRLANPDTLVITAADANHASFGCEDKAKWTYFGDVFFNVALRRADSLKEAFLLARSLVLKRELRQGFDSSHPQMAGGGNLVVKQEMKRSRSLPNASSRCRCCSASSGVASRYIAAGRSFSTAARCASMTATNSSPSAGELRKLH